MADRRGEVDNNLRTATNLLSATSDTPRLDAELLMAHALGIDRQALLLDSSRALDVFRGATGLGVDASVQALAYARDNAEALGVAPRASFRSGDWAAGLDGAFDLILCNPPYIADDEALMSDVADHEPAEALFAGADGLDDYRRIIPDLPRLLAPGGAAILEIGHTQRISVSELAEAAGFAVACRRDLGGRDRALVLTRPE